MSYSHNELYHYGVLGMKWGVRRRSRKRNGGTLLSRKTSILDNIETKKANVQRNRKEAADRIKFYGGKNVALRQIEKEAKYASKVALAKGATKTALLAIGTVGVPALILANGGVLTASGAAIMVAGGASSARAAYATKKAVSTIKNHAEDQISYTKDSEYGADLVISKKRDD